MRKGPSANEEIFYMRQASDKERQLRSDVQAAPASSSLVSFCTHPENETAAFLAAIVESSNDAIISKDLNGIITSWNGGAEHIFGYTSDEAIGHSITMIIPPERLSEEAHILGRIRAGQRVGHFETVRRRKDGADIEISLMVSPLRDASGKIIG